MPEENNDIKGSFSGSSEIKEKIEDKIYGSILAKEKKSDKDSLSSAMSESLNNPIYNSGFKKPPVINQPEKSKADFDRNTSQVPAGNMSNKSLLSFSEKQKSNNQPPSFNPDNRLAQESFRSRSEQPANSIDKGSSKNTLDIKNSGSNESNENNVDQGNEAKEANLNRDKQQGKNKVTTDSKFKQSIAGIGEKMSAIRQGTDKMLQQAFKLALETFTLSMFYAYLHFFLNLIFPKYFCKLGHEWVPEEIKKSNKQEAEKIGEKIGLIEKPGVGCSCIFHLIIIILICATVYFSIYWKQIAWEWFTGLFKGE